MHKEILVSYGNLQAEIDEGIAELVLECWKAGIVTSFCCENEGDSGEIWLQFPKPEYARKFMNITMCDADPGEAWKWEYSAGISDLSIFSRPGIPWQKRKIGKLRKYQLTIGIRFPILYYERLLNNLKKYNERIGK